LTSKILKKKSDGFSLFDNFKVGARRQNILERHRFCSLRFKEILNINFNSTFHQICLREALSIISSIKKETLYGSFEYTGTGPGSSTLAPGFICKFEVWGASGGGDLGGKGGYASGFFSMLEAKSAKTVYVFVGGEGATESSNPMSFVPGGWNGGGGVYLSVFGLPRIIVAGGGGGAGAGSNPGEGGHGGGFQEVKGEDGPVDIAEGYSYIFEAMSGGGEGTQTNGGVCGRDPDHSHTGYPDGELKMNGRLEKGGSGEPIL
jgi:hypothetical protein